MKIVKFTTQDPVMKISIPESFHRKLKILSSYLEISMLSLGGSILNEFFEGIDFDKLEKDFLTKEKLKRKELDEKILKLKISKKFPFYFES